MTRKPLEALEGRLGHRFANRALLARALTHRSAGSDNYERLEFLGDGILNALIGEALYQLRPDAPEGDLSRLRASLVCAPALAAIARELALADYVQLGAGESGIHRRDSVLSDVLEAIIAAVYLDADFATVKTLVFRLFDDRLGALPDAESLKDPKTRLQEYLQARERTLPEYIVLSSVGPAHKRVFEVACRLGDSQQQTTASGSSRRRAEQAAAEAMLTVLHHD